jgi:hypothetical protein
MRGFQRSPTFLRVLIFAAAAVVLLALAAGVGVIAALMLAPNEGSSGGGSPGQSSTQEHANEQENTTREKVPDRPSQNAYLDMVADVQYGSVKASLDSNEKLSRYDTLTDDDVEEMEANSLTLRDYNDQLQAFDPPREYEEQYRLFALAIDELYTANEMAFQLVADPASAAQADFEAYDRHIDKATAYLRRSNEALGKDYKTTETAREVSFE